jgi:hypothetical protein
MILGLFFSLLESSSPPHSFCENEFYLRIDAAEVIRSPSFNGSIEFGSATEKEALFLAHE